MLMFWTNELGIGGTHSYTNVPYVLAGSCGGQLPTGRYIDYIGDATPAYGTGQAHNKLFVSFMKMFGHRREHLRHPGFLRPVAGARAGARLGMRASFRGVLIAPRRRRGRRVQREPADHGVLRNRPTAAAAAAVVARGRRRMGAPTPGQRSCRRRPARAAAWRRARRSRSTSSTRSRSPGVAADATNRIYYLRLPSNYDPNKAYRTIYLGPGCGVPQDLQPSLIKVYPMENAAMDQAILIAMEPGLYNAAHYNSATCANDMSCQYCFDDGADATTANSVEYPYFDALHQAIEASTCVDKNRQFYAGYSSGGWMAQQLGCRFPDVLRAQGNVTGGLPPVIKNGTETCVDPPDRRLPDPRLQRRVERVRGLGGGARTTARAQRLRGRQDDGDRADAPYMIDGIANTATFSCVQYTGCPADYPIVFCTSTDQAHGSQSRQTRSPASGASSRSFDGDPGRVPKPSRDGTRRAKPSSPTQSISPRRATKTKTPASTSVSPGGAPAEAVSRRSGSAFEDPLVAEAEAPVADAGVGRGRGWSIGRRSRRARSRRRRCR